MYETTDDSLFIVRVPVKNPIKVRNLCNEYIKNPKTVTDIIQVTIVDEVTENPVDYYIGSTLKAGHKYLISNSNNAIQFEAAVKYNNIHGYITNNLVAIRYEILNMKAHNETPQEFAAISANNCSKRMGTDDATRYFRVFGNGRSKNSSLQYSFMDQDSEMTSRTTKGTTKYDSSDVNFVLAVQGIWGNKKAAYKEGKFKYDPVLGKDLKPELDFFIQLETISGGRLEMYSKIRLEYAKFYYETVHINRLNVEMTRLVNYLKTTITVNPTKIHGYFDRINKIGIPGSSENWETIYTDISREPGF